MTKKKNIKNKKPEVIVTSTCAEDRVKGKAKMIRTAAAAAQSRAKAKVKPKKRTVSAKFASLSTVRGHRKEGRLDDDDDDDDDDYVWARDDDDDNDDEEQDDDHIRPNIKRARKTNNIQAKAKATRDAASKPKIEVSQAKMEKDRDFFLGLLGILENKNLSDIISWSPNGRAIHVHNFQRFKREVLACSRYNVVVRNYDSWRMRLNRAGFTKTGGERGKYSHPVFVRDKYIRSEQGVRTRNNAIMGTGNTDWREKLVEDMLNSEQPNLKIPVATNATMMDNKKVVMQPKKVSSMKTQVERDREFYLGLLRVLENKDLSDIISWLPNGREFQVHNAERFEKEILASPTYKMTRSNIMSWWQKLRKFGFIPMSMKRRYSHPVFIRQNYIQAEKNKRNNELDWQDQMVEDLLKYASQKKGGKKASLGLTVENEVLLETKNVSMTKRHMDKDRTFYLELLGILENKDLSGIISWLPSQREFQIHNIARFEKEILDSPNYKIACKNRLTWWSKLRTAGFIPVDETRKYAHPVFDRQKYLQEHGTNTRGIDWKEHMVDDLLNYIVKKKEEKKVMQKPTSTLIAPLRTRGTITRNKEVSKKRKSTAQSKLSPSSSTKAEKKESPSTTKASTITRARRTTRATKSTTVTTTTSATASKLTPEQVEVKGSPVKNKEIDGSGDGGGASNISETDRYNEDVNGNRKETGPMSTQLATATAKKTLITDRDILRAVDEIYALTHTSKADQKMGTRRRTRRRSDKDEDDNDEEIHKSITVKDILSSVEKMLCVALKKDQRKLVKRRLRDIVNGVDMNVDHANEDTSMDNDKANPNDKPKSKPTAKKTNTGTNPAAAVTATASATKAKANATDNNDALLKAVDAVYSDMLAQTKGNLEQITVRDVISSLKQRLGSGMDASAAASTKASAAMGMSGRSPPLTREQRKMVKHRLVYLMDNEKEEEKEEEEKEEELDDDEDGHEDQHVHRTILRARRAENFVCEFKASDQLPPGWVVHIRRRLKGKRNGKHDAYWYTSTGKILRSHTSIVRFLGHLKDCNGDEHTAWKRFQNRDLEPISTVSIEQEGIAKYLPEAAQGKQASVSDKEFYLELLDILENKDLSGIISWLPNGRDIQVHNVERFESGVLSNSIYKVSSLSSCANHESWRQKLREDGFITLIGGKRKYSHPVFIKANYFESQEGGNSNHNAILVDRVNKDWRGTMVEDLLKYIKQKKLDRNITQKAKQIPTTTPSAASKIAMSTSSDTSAALFLLEECRKMLQSSQSPSIRHNLGLHQDNAINDPTWNMINDMLRERDELQANQSRIVEALITNPSMIDDYDYNGELYKSSQKRKACTYSSIDESMRDVDELTDKISEAIDISRKKRRVFESWS